MLRLWDTLDAFRTSVEFRPETSEYTFYDGPPFATGTPHYGHLLAGTIKDIVPRYWNMRGYQVERRFGWDCHGLPIETGAEKRSGCLAPADRRIRRRPLQRAVPLDGADLRRRMARP